MPIVVQHTPNPVLMGQIANQAGFGMYQQRQEQQDFQNFQVAQRAQQEQAAQQARLQLAAQQQAIDAETRGRQQMLEAGRLQMGWQQNQVENQFRGQQLQSQDAWRAGQIQQDELQRQNAIKLQEQGNQARWGMDSANDMERVIDGVRSESIRMQLSPEGKTILGKQMETLRGLQKNRGKMKPEEYTRNLGQWLENYERSGVKDHVIEPPTIDQTVKENAIPQVDPVTGEPTGGFWVRDIKGQLKLEMPKAGGARQKQDPTVPVAHGQASPASKPPVFGVPHDPAAMPSFEQWIANPTTLTKEMEEARKVLTVEPKPAGPTNPTGTPGHTPKPKEIEQYIRDKYAMQQRLTGMMGASRQGTSPQTTGLTLEQAQAEYDRMVASGANEAQMEPIAKQLRKIQEEGNIPRSAPPDGGVQFPLSGPQQDPMIPGMPRSMQPGFEPAPPQAQPGLPPGVPAPPLPQNPLAPQPVTPAEPVAPPRAMMPEHKAAYDQVVKAVGGPDLVNEDALAREVQAREMRGLKTGTPGQGGNYLNEFQTEVTRLKFLMAKKGRGEKLTQDEMKEGAELGLRVSPYLKSKTK